MKRSVCALMTAAAVVGCQSPETTNHQMYTAAAKPAMGQAAKQAAKEPVVAANTDGKMKVDPNLQQVGYNHGWGAAQNRNFNERVAAAVPSRGGMVPGGNALQMPGAGGMGMGYPGMGGGMPGGGMGPGGPGCGPDGGGSGMGGPGMGPRFVTGRSQIRFVKPTGMKIAWQTTEGEMGGFTRPQLETPARYNFLQARIYRLKVTDIGNRPGLELYPTLEVYPGNVKVDPYLSHNAVPIEMTDEDFDQVQAGNFVTKVIYLPDPKFQELAIAGVETLVSTRLDPGVDPVAEAHRRGAILAVLRIGSLDLEMPHSPPMYAPPGGMPGAVMMNAANAGKIQVTPVSPMNAASPNQMPTNVATRPMPTMPK